MRGEGYLINLYNKMVETYFFNLSKGKKKHIHSLCCFIAYLKSHRSIEGPEIEFSFLNSQFLVEPPENTPFLLVHLLKYFADEKFYYYLGA